MSRELSKTTRGGVDGTVQPANKPAMRIHINRTPTEVPQADLTLGVAPLAQGTETPRIGAGLSSAILQASLTSRSDLFRVMTVGRFILGLFVLVALPLATAQSEAGILGTYLQQYDMVEVQGDPCRRHGGVYFDVEDQMVPLAPTNLLLSHHVLWHRLHDRDRVLDDAYRAETDAYGTLFVEFHHHMIHAYDTWRTERGYAPSPVWDPATPIPVELRNPHLIPAGVLPSDPPETAALALAVCIAHDSEDPRVAMPTWATEAGGDEADPVYGYRSLCAFPTLNALAKAIDAVGIANLSYHSAVHNGVGGDLRYTLFAPRDPTFWAWHKYLDVAVFQTYQERCEDLALDAASDNGAQELPGLAIGTLGLALAAAAASVRRRR